MHIFKTSLAYFKGDGLAVQVWLNKYALKYSEGNIYERTPDDIHYRIAKEIARIENKYPNPMAEDEVFNLIKKVKYIVSQGSSLA
jgi:ribonucleoside-diphosphate reductase alpha chain